MRPKGEGYASSLSLRSNASFRAVYLLGSIGFFRCGVFCGTRPESSLRTRPEVSHSAASPVAYPESLARPPARPPAPIELASQKRGQKKSPLPVWAGGLVVTSYLLRQR